MIPEMSWHADWAKHQIFSHWLSFDRLLAAGGKRRILLSLTEANEASRNLLTAQIREIFLYLRSPGNAVRPLIGPNMEVEP
jgi:hypothetical protein